MTGTRSASRIASSVLSLLIIGNLNMGFYQRRILPWLIARGMQNEVMEKHRPRVPTMAVGRVLEVGLGSGLNIPHYGDAVVELFGLEPSKTLLAKAAPRAAAAPFPVELMLATAEKIPLDNGCLDTVVSTWALCSIPDIETALLEIRRVLKPTGQFLFLDHGRAPDPGVARWQDRLAPVCRGLLGCHPNRQMDQLVQAAGFAFTDLEMTYFDGPRFMAYHYIGQASPL